MPPLTPQTGARLMGLEDDVKELDGNLHLILCSAAKANV